MIRLPEQEAHSDSNARGNVTGFRPSGRNLFPLILLAVSLVPGSGCADSATSPQQDGDVEVTLTADAFRDVDRRQHIRPDAEGVYHVHPGTSIQEVMDAAAADSQHKRIHIHEGTYRPQFPSQAMIRFHAKHDGLDVRGEGDVVLTAENADVAVVGTAAYPAVVNHVVYFGHGISKATRLSGITITGANGFATNSETDGPIEPASGQPGLEKRMFFYLDGGAIKIFGNSSPVIDRVRILNNRTQLCGGGISIEQRGVAAEPVRISNCILAENRCPATGAAVDLLEGSQAMIENCLFRDNIANTGMAEIEARFGLRYKEQHGCGALTVFPGSRAEVIRCTFTRNWNGVDDQGSSVYRDCIFRENVASDGSLPGAPYEMDVAESVQVFNCWISGGISDLRGTVDPTQNRLQAPDPEFDDQFEPLNPSYESVGYRVADGNSDTSLPR